MNKNKNTTRMIVNVAIYAALFIVFDLMQNNMGLLQMPNGGSLGISTVIILLASYQLGYKTGLLVGLISVFLQFLTGPMYIVGILGFMLDYVIGFAVYGLASLFKNYKYFYPGVLISNILRFISVSLSGVYVFGLDWIPSMAYNITYMLPTAIVGMILVPILHERLKTK
ncbi:MAG: hypothetical protein GX760_00670 [Erysipelothrix sp.]|nr:hypothetical protein [Erysipelothrix sp.]